ncbi:GH18904 [Drosophila grimshawi]|uniref:GH18904 n=1 Tax=Drosophila grimshawi TaxID=7222 RepID=B4JGU4_DROGR|nr:GH18904 [Drosophila grimshawi]
MYYPQELARPRARPPLYGNYIDETGTRCFKSPRCCRKSTVSGPILTYVKGYCDTSSLHGIRYLTDSKLRHFERFIWLLILVGTFICATIVYIDLSALYNSGRVQTTIENSMQPVFRISFPSVGICPRSRINWLKMQQEVPQQFLGANATQEQKDVFIQFFTAVSTVIFEDMSNLKNIFENQTLAANVHQLDGLDVSSVLRYAHHDCTDIFVECKWRGKQQNCCEIFELQITELGICWIFNSAVSVQMQQRAKVDKYYPLRTAKAGPGTGLDVFLRLNKSLVYPGVSGSFMIIKQPQQWSDSARELPTNSFNSVSLTPRYTNSEAGTRTVDAKQRGCLFPDEIHNPYYKNLPGFTYWRGNCRTKCHQEYAIKLCNCSADMFFPRNKDDHFVDCKPSDFRCLYDHRLTFGVERLPLEQEYVDSVFKEYMICDCLNSCSQLVYDTIFSSNALDSDEMRPDAYSMHLDVFFQSPWFIKYQTQMRFTFVELLASFGGIAGLFLGASLLSAFELVYYFTIGLYLYLFGGNRKSKQTSPAQPVTIYFPRKIKPIKVKY